MSATLYTTARVQKVDTKVAKLASRTLTDSAQNKFFNGLAEKLNTMLPSFVQAKKVKAKLPANLAEVLSTVPTNTNRNKQGYKKFQNALLKFEQNGFKF